jgi:hypothetical protein
MRMQSIHHFHMPPLVKPSDSLVVLRSSGVETFSTSVPMPDATEGGSLGATPLAIVWLWLLLPWGFGPSCGAALKSSPASSWGDRCELDVG